MRVKHFRLETEEKRYLLALLPINFGKLAEDRSSAGVGRAVESTIAIDGVYMLAIDDEAYVEADPYGWLDRDWNLVCAHFYLREKAKELRGGQVLHASEVRDEVDHIVRKLAGARSGDSVGARPAFAPTDPPTDTPRQPSSKLSEGDEP